MNYQRIDRISEQVRREVDTIIREDLSDPRIKGTFTVTHADVTRDLRYAKVYISILEEENHKPVMDALQAAAGYVRYSLGKRMMIRYTPEILFVLDKNIEHGIHIASVLKQVYTEDSSHAENG